MKYTKTHEWVTVDNEQLATIGITRHAQELLGDIVYVELPAIDAIVSAQKSFGVIESVKAAADLYAPISGVVVAVNDRVTSEPAQVQISPEDQGWLIKIKPHNLAELTDLLSAEEYQHCCTQEH